MAKSKKEKSKEDEEENSGGMSLDEAFADDEDVVYAESKPKKKKENKEDKSKENSKAPESENITIKQSKPITSLKKGDKIKLDNKTYEVDANYVLIDHKTTKEMALEFFDEATDKDFQLRYFPDRLEGSLELFELQKGFMYVKTNFSKIEW